MVSSKYTDFFLGILVIFLIGVIDYQTGYELSFSPFYLLPIFLMAWRKGYQGVILSAILSVVVWQLADMMSFRPNQSLWIYGWNSSMRLITYLVVGLLVSRLRTELNKQEKLASLDPLTQAYNGRAFTRLLQKELERSNRYPHLFSMVYIDLDNFKSVNDRFGHAMGDEVLCHIVQETKKHLREIDCIARLGGDEFGILLLETDQAGAREVVARIVTEIEYVAQNKDWQIALSVGVLTIHDAKNLAADTVINLADQLMYSIKRSGKNAVCFGTHPEKSLEK